MERNGICSVSCAYNCVGYLLWHISHQDEKNLRKIKILKEVMGIGNIECIRVAHLLLFGRGRIDEIDSMTMLIFVR